MRRLDAVEHDADAGRELLEEGEVPGGELGHRRQRQHRLDLVLEHHREDHHAARQRAQHHWLHRHRVGGDVAHQDAALFHRALADEALAQRQRGRIAALARVGVARQHAQPG